MKYRFAKCCSPQKGDNLVAFVKQDADVFSVHRSDCPNIAKVDPSRLVAISGSEVEAPDARQPRDIPPELLAELDDVDLAILRHHQRMGRDYAAVVARHTRIDRATIFERHRKLRDLNLLRRIEAKMMRYRKGIVDGKWIKHRNHTYYELTALGTAVCEHAGGSELG